MVSHLECPLLLNIGFKHITERYQLKVQLMAAVTHIYVHAKVLSMTLIGKSQLQCKATLEFIGNGYGQGLLLAIGLDIAVVIHAEPVLYHPVNHGTRQAAGYLEIHCVAHYSVGVGVKTPKQFGVRYKCVVITAGNHPDFINC